MLMGAEMFDTLTVISPFTAEECKLANSMSHDRFNFCCYIGWFVKYLFVKVFFKQT